MKQPKLKIGSKVKIINNKYFHFNKIGSVSKVNEDGLVQVCFSVFSYETYPQHDLQLIPNTKSKWKYTREEIVKLLIANPILSSTKAFIEMRDILMDKQDQPVDSNCGESAINKTKLSLDNWTIKFDEFRNFDGCEYGLVLHEKIKTFIQYQIQKAYSKGREEVVKELRVRIDTWGGFEDEGGNLCHYDSQIIEYLDDLSIQSKGKIK